MRLVLISGMSGSGKSVALNVLEDAGFFCVDNLPAPLLPQLVGHLRDAGYSRVAVAVDVRSGKSMSALPPMMGVLRNGTELQTLFLDARDDALIARFSETRRRHPLGDDQTSLAEAIRRERDLLEPIVALGHRIDTSDLPSAVLRKWVRELVQIDEGSGLSRQISRKARVDSSSGVETRTISAPTLAERMIWSSVAATSVVGVLVMVWTEIGAPPPTGTLPTMIRRDTRRSMLRQGRTGLCDMGLPAAAAPLT